MNEYDEYINGANKQPRGMNSEWRTIDDIHETRYCWLHYLLTHRSPKVW
jgi:hypothetical protein